MNRQPVVWKAWVLCNNKSAEVYFAAFWEVIGFSGCCCSANGTHSTCRRDSGKWFSLASTPVSLTEQIFLQIGFDKWVNVRLPFISVYEKSHLNDPHVLLYRCSTMINQGYYWFPALSPVKYVILFISSSSVETWDQVRLKWQKGGLETWLGFDWS